MISLSSLNAAIHHEAEAEIEIITQRSHEIQKELTEQLCATEKELDALKTQLADAKAVLKEIWVQGVCAGDLKCRLAEILESKGAGERGE